MSAVTKQEIVEVVKAHLNKMGWEYATHPELKPMFDLFTKIEQHGIAPPDGWVLVPKEPTAEMLKAFHWKNVGEGYAAMLAAAPDMSKKPENVNTSGGYVDCAEVKP